MTKTAPTSSIAGANRKSAVTDLVVGTINGHIKGNMAWNGSSYADIKLVRDELINCGVSDACEIPTEFWLDMAALYRGQGWEVSVESDHDSDLVLVFKFSLKGPVTVEQS